ncbi:MAG: hypothetical protein WBE00_09380, partial [Phycisphaerae bacterium]
MGGLRHRLGGRLLGSLSRLLTGLLSCLLTGLLPRLLAGLLSHLRSGLGGGLGGLCHLRRCLSSLGGAGRGKGLSLLLKPGCLLGELLGLGGDARLLRSHGSEHVVLCEGAHLLRKGLLALLKTGRLLRHGRGLLACLLTGLLAGHLRCLGCCGLSSGLGGLSGGFGGLSGGLGGLPGLL